MKNWWAGALVTGLLTSTGCIFSYDREDDLSPGEVVGVALRAEEASQTAERSPYARVSTESETRRATSDGTFVLGPLPAGGWTLRIEDDEDGDGWPDRATVLHARVTVLDHPTGLFNETESRLTTLDLGPVPLPGTFGLRGTVALHPALESIADVTRVVAVRDLCPPPEGAASAVEDMVCPALDGPPPAGRIPLGVEAENAVDETGAFALKSLAAGSVQIVAFAHEVDQTGALGRVVGLSRAAFVEREGAATEVELADPIDVLPADPSARRVVRIQTVPPVVAATLVRVPASRAPPPCPDPVAEESVFEEPFAYASAHPLVATGDVVKASVPTGVWDLFVCADDARGDLFGQVLLPLLPDEEPPVLGPVVLRSGPTCGDPRDCDRDGRPGLPPLAGVVADAADEGLWAECGPTCANESHPQECVTSGGTFDCDDDADGQPDVTEGRACYGPGLGTDYDADDLCSGADPWPWCAANNEQACAAGEYDDDPPNRHDGERDAGPPPDAGAPTDAGPQVTVEGDRQIASAADLAALAGVAEITGSLTLSGTDLTSLAGLESLEVVGGSVTLAQNAGLTSLDALASLREVGGTLEIRENPALDDAGGLAALETVQGDLVIVSNPTLVALGFTSLREVTGTLSIYFNDSLSTLSGMPALTGVGSILLYFNPSLTSLDFDAMPTVANHLHLVTNTGLLDLAALSMLTSVGGDLTVSDNDAITGLSELASLTSVGGDLYLFFNDSLATADLPALTSIGGSLTVRQHTALGSLAMDALVVVDGDYEVVDNPGLPSCEAQGVLDGLSGFAGAWTISGNDAAATCP